MNEFLSWETLATYGGALAAVGALTQFTKEIPGIKKIPTQLWSYILSLLVLFPATAFTVGLTWQSAALILFNGAAISLSANGGYAALERVAEATKTGTHEKSEEESLK